MAIYLVNQGKTYQYERAGNYIWSPKLNKAGNQNRGYNLMKSVRKGDFIIHNSGRKLSAISVVQEDCKSGGQPKELKEGQNTYDWDDDGWVVNTKYYDFDVPLLTYDLVEWAIANYAEDSAFQVNGKLRLQYLCNLTKDHAEYLLQRAIGFQEDPDVLQVLRAALSSLNPVPKTDEELAEEMTLKELEKTAAKRSSKAVEQKEVTTKQYSRDPYISELAKRLANGKCELCGLPAPFKDSKGKPYLETHHVIWLSQGGSDSVDNTVALCPNCHRKMHIVADPSDVAKLKIVAKNNAI